MVGRIYIVKRVVHLEGVMEFFEFVSEFACYSDGFMIFVADLVLD